MTSDFIKKVLREHLLLVLIILLLLPFTGLSVFSLFFSSNREIIYEQHQVFEHCARSVSAAEACTALYEIIIGNTGTQEETLRLVWPLDLSGWGRSHSILNIAADEPREHDPGISCENSSLQSTCTLDRFSPGALVILKFTCLACSAMETGTMEENPVAVETTARIAHGDPRVNIFFRRLQNLLNIFL